MVEETLCFCHHDKE